MDREVRGDLGGCGGDTVDEEGDEAVGEEREDGPPQS